MSELEWLIADRFTLNSGGKTPQQRRMESATKDFSSRMCPSSLNFTSDSSPRGVTQKSPYYDKSPLKNIGNYLRQRSRHSSSLEETNKRVFGGSGKCHSAKLFGDDFSSMEVFQSLPTTGHLSQSDGSYFGVSGCDSSTLTDYCDRVPLTTASLHAPVSRVLSANSAATVPCRPPDSSSVKVARMDRSCDNKENIFSSSHLLSGDVVRSPTRVDFSSLLSPRRKGSASLGLDNRPTPSKFTMVKNTLSRRSSLGPPAPVPAHTTHTPKKHTAISPTQDFTSRDSGFENSLSFEDKIPISTLETDDGLFMKGPVTANLGYSESALEMVKFHDELTQSACHFEPELSQKQLEDVEIYENPDNLEMKSPLSSLSLEATRRRNKAGAHSSGEMHSNKGSPVAHCSKFPGELFEEKTMHLDECEYETLHDMEEFDTTDIALGSTMSKYEIISTDSPDIALAGAPSSAVGRILANDFDFGSPIGEEETSKNFGPYDFTQQLKNIPSLARTETTRMLNFDTPSPEHKKDVTCTASLGDGSIFKLAIEKLSNKREVVTFDSGLGAEEAEMQDEDSLLVLDELEDKGEEPPSSLHSLIHNAVLHEVEDSRCRNSPMNEGSPLAQLLKRPAFRRCFSLNQPPEDREAGQARSSLLYDESPKSFSNSNGGFKRPEHTRGAAFLGTRKRRKQSSGDVLSLNRKCETFSEEKLHGGSQAKSHRPSLQRAMSDTEATINMGLTRSLEETDLIGDFSGNYILPVVRSQHSDLKVISPDTLAALLRGDYRDTVQSFQIIDCRYPYEYEGGHIEGALNLYTEEMVEESLITERLEKPLSPNTRRHILIFHCEFSMQRGPKLVRYLRWTDRALHKASYPTLLHPELYLLGGGYCLFSSKHPLHTVPRGGCYTTMLDPCYVEQRRKYQWGKGKGRRGEV